jgi:hypothetical protein
MCTQVCTQKFFVYVYACTLIPQTQVNRKTIGSLLTHNWHCCYQTTAVAAILHQNLSFGHRNWTSTHDTDFYHFFPTFSIMYAISLIRKNGFTGYMELEIMLLVAQNGTIKMCNIYVLTTNPVQNTHKIIFYAPSLNYNLLKILYSISS